MKILVSGASGLIGSELTAFWKGSGHEVITLKRKNDNDPFMAPKGGWEGYDAWVNLAGATVSSRWTKSYKEEILNSRIATTHQLVKLCQGLTLPPKVFINASAIGYYGDRDDITLDEESEPGTGFLPEVVKSWENELNSLQRVDVRTVALRLGVVLSRKGGALKKMLLPFNLGLGGKLGNGEQFMSWIAIEDVVGAIDQILQDNAFRGAVNLVAPHPVRNSEFTKVMGEVLHRPTFFDVPAIAIDLLLGEMGRSLLLASTKVEPKKLLMGGYPFLYPTLKEALLSATAKT